MIKDELAEAVNVLESFKLELRNQSPSDKKVYKGVSDWQPHGRSSCRAPCRN